MAFRALIKKDLRLLLADKRTLLINMIVPVVLASFVGYIFAPRSGPASRIQIGLVDQDDSARSRALAKDLAAEEALEVVPLDETTARKRIAEGDLTAAVVIPAGTGAKIGLTAMFTDQKPHIDLLIDPSRNIDAKVIEGLLTKVAMQQVGRAFGSRQQGTEQLEQARAWAEKMGDAEQREQWTSFFDAGVRAMASTPDQAAGADGAKGGFQMPIEIEQAPVLRQGARFNSYAHSFAGMIVMYLFFVATDGGVGVIEERTRGTWRRLRIAPVRRSKLLVSKVFATFLQALLVALVVYAFGAAVFGIRIQGSVVGFAAVVLMSAVCVASFALLLMGLGRSRSQVQGYSIFAVLVMAFLGGAWFPVFLMPDWLQAASMAVPTHWMMQGLTATTWRGLGMEAVWLPLAALAGFSALFAGIGLKAFRWEE